MPMLADIAAYLDQYLKVERWPDDGGGILVNTASPMRHLVLALGVADVARTGARDFDALLLHRWWGHESLALPGGVGVLGYHKPFDECMTPGRNRDLAATLGMSAVEPVSLDDGREIGMMGDVDARSAASWIDFLSREFGGCEASVMPMASGDVPVRRIAIIEAMTDGLVRACHARGAALYVTGQLRKPARQAVADTKMAVFAIGHERSERWAMRALAGGLQSRWPDLAISQL